MSNGTGVSAADFRRQRTEFTGRLPQPGWPEKRKGVASPCVSIGNLAMGGRGKTPAVIHVARLLLAAGEHPAVLSRGYGRRLVEPGVVVVSDGEHVIADLDRSGDEPLLIARSVPGVAVLVSEQRAIARTLATVTFGSTVVLLDDGFQHRQVSRQVDLVLVAGADLHDRRIPFGSLREPVSALSRSDALIGVDVEAGALAAVAPGKPTFTLRRALGDPVPLQRDMVWPDRRAPVVAVAGIANPERFRDSLASAGWTVARLVSVPDHHAYTRRDLNRIEAAMRETGATAAVTTEKDAVRLRRLRPLPWPIAAVPLNVTIEPADTFRSWLLACLREARQ